MPCSSCNNNTPLVFDVQTFLNTSCNSCGDSQCFPAKNVCYTGPDLPCSGIETNDNLDDAFTKIDEQICSAIGDYSAYQKNCLPEWAENALNTEALFVDAITGYACETRADLDAFINTTYPTYITTIDNRFLALESPAFTCASVGITTGDTLETVYTKYCSKFTAIDTALNLSSINFGGCFTVTVPPTTVKAGFTEVLSQICSLKAELESSGVIIPTFNNTGSCLATPGSADSLFDTVNKIRTKLCTLPTWDSTALTWGCVGSPTTDLGDGIQRILTKVNYMLPKVVTFGSGFTTAPTNVGNPCDGVTVSLDSVVDRNVAATSSDLSPSTLDNKLVGVGIAVNTVLNTNKITLVSDHKVLVNNIDDTPDFLFNKLVGSTSNGVTITPTYNSFTKKIDLILNVDPNFLCTLLGDCSSVVPCITYIVTPVSGSSALSYTDCSGNVLDTISISGATTICAKLGSVYAPNATIVNSGNCSSSTVCAAPPTIIDAVLS